MLISKEEHWRSPAKKLAEVKTTRLQGLQEKLRGTEKTKRYFNKPSRWLKRMIAREQENVFLFEFGLIVPAALKCLFRHNLCRRSLPT